MLIGSDSTGNTIRLACFACVLQLNSSVCWREGERGTMLAVVLACLEINQTPRRTDVTAIKQDRLVDELQTGTAEMNGKEENGIGV